MARRPSTVSVNSIPPIVAAQDRSKSRSNTFSSDALPNLKVNGPPLPTRTVSLSARTQINSQIHLYDNGTNTEPDELFSKHAVSEVKAIQQRLRADAEDKQEELRLMVGERYRDLLQASTSIISIARSSAQVLKVLKETKDAILSQEISRVPRRSQLSGEEDAHLQTLQLLSAHMKLLLDAPECLWRLIERKRYFDAAWLFLLARVVHRALVHDNEQEDDTWSSQGIDVLAQFPLVERQWDAISHFRSQIVHKATLSLREHSESSEDVCATLLTLHILDSRPMADTLSVLLFQRSKSLHGLLSKNPRSSHRTSISHSLSRRSEKGVPPELIEAEVKIHRKSRKRSTHEVTKAIQVSLHSIACTLGTARDIFQEHYMDHCSMIENVLQYIHSESQSIGKIPPILQLNTQALLKSLPSSTYFLLLPPAISSYKPYVDITSSSSSIPQPSLVQKLEEWFRSSSVAFSDSLETWLDDVQIAEDVWQIRLAVRKYTLSFSKLAQREKDYILSQSDDLCRQRLVSVMKTALLGAADAFREHLSSTMSALNQNDDSYISQASTVNHLFQSPPLPILTQSVGGPIIVDSALHKYRQTLRAQLVGRTSLLDDLLGILEECAKALQRDLSPSLSIDDITAKNLIAECKKLLLEDTETLCTSIINILDEAAGEIIKATSPSMICLIFASQVADQLSSSSPFAADLCCGPQAKDDFRASIQAIHVRVVDCWRIQVVSSVIDNYWRTSQQPVDEPAVGQFASRGPSPALIHGLHTLSSSVQELEISREPLRRGPFAREALCSFVVVILKDLKCSPWQGLWDLAFLRQLLNLWGPEQIAVSDSLDKKVSQLHNELQHIVDLPELGQVSTDYLIKTQVLLSALLPPSPRPPPVQGQGDEKFATLLPYGISNSDQSQMQSAMEIVKPTARFVLLLVGNTVGQ